METVRHFCFIFFSSFQFRHFIECFFFFSYLQLNDFNWEINLFLKNLIVYQNNVNKANQVTKSLLNEILATITQFQRKADVCDAANDFTNFNKKDEIFFKIDESKFEIRHLITCRVCHVSICSCFNRFFFFDLFRLSKFGAGDTVCFFRNRIDDFEN